MFSALQKTSIWNAFSPLGKSIETPKGIFYWSSRAINEAEINGTIGVAQDDDGTISHLKMAESWAGSNVMARVPKGKIFGYAPIEGVLSLREKWLKYELAAAPILKAHACLPVVTNGITHSLAIAGRMLLESGQTLITAEKSWENYEHIFEDIQGIKITTFQLFTNGALHIDAIIGSCREVAVSQGKVVLLLNFPHNQTGFMPSEADAKEFGARMKQLCQEMPNVPFVIILDDAYEGYVYDETGLKHSMLGDLFSPLPNFAIVKLDGISKVMLAYGYRIGFINVFLSSDGGKALSDEELKTVRPELGSKIGGFIRGEISQVNHHGQILADALMDDFDSVMRERNEVIRRLKERWEAMIGAVSKASQKFGNEKIWIDPCNGGFFAYFNVAGNFEPKTIAERLLKEKKVGVVPGDRGLRVAFCGVPKEKIPTMINAIFEVANM